MQLFYAPDITLPRYVLDEEESKHCTRVLRMGAGDAVSLVDGRGNLYSGRIAEASPKRCTVNIERTEREYGRLPYSLTMAVAPTKNSDRFEWFLEKATEVGVTRIVPVVCDRSERRTVNAERCMRVAVSAMKQSLKAYLPAVEPAVPLRTFIAEAPAGDRFVAHCADEPHEKAYLPSLLQKGGDTTILIGPEGDFSPEEINFALANGFRPVSLGPQRLRTETAAVAAAVMTAVANTL